MIVYKIWLAEDFNSFHSFFTGIFALIIISSPGKIARKEFFFIGLRFELIRKINLYLMICNVFEEYALNWNQQPSKFYEMVTTFFLSTYL